MKRALVLSLAFGALLFLRPSILACATPTVGRWERVELLTTEEAKEELLAPDAGHVEMHCVVCAENTLECEPIRTWFQQQIERKLR